MQESSIRIFYALLMEFVVTMAIGLLIPPIGSSTAQASSSEPAETGQTQHCTQSGTFSVFLKQAVKNTTDEQVPSCSDAGHSIEPTSVIAVGDQTTGASLMGLVVVSLSQVPDTQEGAPLVDDKNVSVPTGSANASVIQNSSPSPTPTSTPTPIPTSNPTPTMPSIQSIELMPILPQGLTMAIAPDDGTVAPEPVAAHPSPSKTTDSSSVSLPQPVLDRDQTSEVLATHTAVPATNKPAIRNDRVAPSHLAPVPLEQSSEVSALSGTRPPSSLMADQGAPPIMENQGNPNLLPAAQGMGNAPVPPLVRPSTDIRPSALVQEQGDLKTTLMSQSLSVRVLEAGGGEQAPFGDSAQAEGEARFFQFNAGEAQESVVRGNQSPFFSDQFMSARQAAQSPQGIGSPVATSTADHLKLTQGLLAGEHLATMTSTSGMPQTIHVQLPAHESGPLNVRISMIDQTVHTQFTTDRSDLGALLFMRQDQLQQNLIRSGLELGQFQVHVNQEGRQDTLPDRQPRRNDGTADQQPASQDHNRQAHDRDRPNHRPMRALSLFA